MSFWRHNDIIIMSCVCYVKKDALNAESLADTAMQTLFVYNIISSCESSPYGKYNFL